MGNNNSYIFTSESVSEGHPDKIADQISDAILDNLISKDPNCRVACETFVKTGMVLIGGEISTNSWVDTESIARAVIKEIGYNNSAMGFDWESCAVLTAIGKQSPDIAMGVDQENNILGAGDQGIMFGYATNETDCYMPAPITVAHSLVKKQADLRKNNNSFNWLRPDAKSQVSFYYNENGEAQYIDTIVFSTQHSPEIDQNTLKEAVIEEIIKPTVPKNFLNNNTKFLINPTGRFVIGGPQGDSGLTGRKIIVDTYGGMARHGGGAFSGKDPSKVDRSAAYACRHVAKNIVAAGLADRCEIQLAYAIGIAEPVSIHIETFNTGKISHKNIEHLVRKHFDLTPRGIIDTLDLIRPIYKKTAAYGHFGRDDHDFTWEKLDKVNTLKEEL